MSNKFSYNLKIKIKKIFLEFLIIVIKSLAFLFHSAGKIIFVIVGTPLLKLARLVFYKVIVKLYCHYWSLVRKAGWDRQKKRTFLSFVLNEKIVHVAIAAIVFLVVLTNLIPFTSAESKMEKSRDAIIYNLVQSEFGEFESKEKELIRESLNKENLASRINTKKRHRDKPLALGGSSLRSENLEDNTSLKKESVSTSSGKQELSQVQVAEESLKNREEVITYEVQPGDTVSSIADKFNISVNTILWENDLSAYDLIRPGDKLTILPVTGVSHEVGRGESLSYIANEYDVDRSKIVEANEIENPERLSIGEKLVIPGGEKQQDASSDSSQTSEDQSSNYSALSAVKDIVKPDKKQPQTASDKMHWPTPGHRITQYYSWRHHGLDIADDIGTPLYAADAGIIEFVGWSRGYGNNIVIDHGGGKKTRYAHLNQFYVSRGERVSRGQALGEMGNTGWSTGPHVHFEVVIHGRRQNPLNYTK